MPAVRQGVDSTSNQLLYASKKGNDICYFLKQLCYSSLCLQEFVQEFQFVVRINLTHIRFSEPLESKQYCVTVLL